MAVTKSEGDGNHPSSHYLVVEDASKPTTWHLRVRDMSGKPNHTLMGAAWAALHGGYRGNKYAGPQKEAALKKLTSLYRSEGIPTPGGKSLFYKDKDGQGWFLGFYSNNFEDREGETFSWDSHKEYVAWVKEMGVKLPVTIAHQPKHPLAVHLAMFMGLASKQLTAEEFSDTYLKLYKPFAFAQTEAIIPLNGFMLVIAKILTGKEKVVELLNKSDWGMSHGYLLLEQNGKTIDQYRTFEFTSLPPALAANSITVSSFTEIKETMDATKNLDKQDLELLKKALDADPETVEEATRAARDVLQKVLASKELENDTDSDEEAASEDENATNVLQYDEIRTKIFADMALDQLQAAFKTIVNELANVNAWRSEVEQRVKATERSEDERIAEKFTAKPVWDFKGFGAAQEPDNADDLREKALGDKPLPGVQGNGQDANNPLAHMWQVIGHS